MIILNRYAEAREEILRAITCKEPYGHASEPWLTWIALHNLEAAEGNGVAASVARLKAIELYLSYRNDGGENHSWGGRLCHDFRQAVNQNRSGEMATTLEELAKHPEVPTMSKLLISKLRAMLGGSRDPELWRDEGLWFMDAVEIKLLVNGH